MLKKNLLLIVSFLVFSTTACSQKLVDITDKKEVLIDIEFVGKPGQIKKYLIQTDAKSINPPIPNAYEVFEKKYYKIQSSLLAYDQPIFTFKTPANQEDFAKIRILHLIENELNPNGSEWQDCTIDSNRLGNPSDSNYSAKSNERLNKFLPDFAQKTVSCELSDGMKSEDFFLVVLQTQPAPTEPFTKITWNLESNETSTENNAVHYKISFTNAGTKDIGEFNFRSVFGLDTKLNSYKPSQGNCRTSTYSSSYGSVVCHMGKIPAGKSVSLELESENSSLGGLPENQGKKNRTWQIYGYYKESPNDAVWNPNAVWFQPILNRDLLKK